MMNTNFDLFLKKIDLRKEDIADITALECLFEEQIKIMGENGFALWCEDVLSSPKVSSCCVEDSPVLDLFGKDEETGESTISGYTCGTLSSVIDIYGYRINDREDTDLVLQANLKGFDVK